MYKHLIICLVSLSMLMYGCKAEETDHTENWVGLYTSSNPRDSFSSLIISKADANDLNIIIKSQSGGYVYTYTTLKHVSVNTLTQSTINENDNLITGNTGPYSIQGTITLSGGTLSVNATATQGTDARAIDFTGIKH